MPRLLLFATLSLLLVQCAKYNPRTAFDPQKTPAAPDYAQVANWAALPDHTDLADRTPNADIRNQQENALVDIFFLYPTTLTEDVRGGRVWNGDVADPQLNKKTDESSILYQATAFNGAGRVFAPRYRQAHYYSFVTKDKASADRALDTAYSDVLRAFRYYLEHWNNGRPFIIAGHSQGARHAKNLLHNEVENTGLADRLVAAYLMGWPVEQGFFQKMPPCQSPEQTGCYCSWRTFERQFGLKNADQRNVICTNPILWTISEKDYAPKSLHQGAVLRKFEVVYPRICDAEVYKGVLLCTKPKFPGSVLLRTKNYHIGDVNLYWMDVRTNAELRANTFLKEHGQGARN